MATTVTLTLDDVPDAEDALRSLHGWLAEDIHLRGLVRMTGRPGPTPAPGLARGSVLVLEASSTALASALVGWIRHQSAGVDVTVKRRDGRLVRIAGSPLRDLSPPEVHQAIIEVTAQVDASIPRQWSA